MSTTKPSIAAGWRPKSERPTLGLVLWRVVVITVATALTLWLLAAVLGGFSIDTWQHALLAGFVVGVVNAVVWPALAFIVVPISVVTLGLGAIVLDAILVAVVLDWLPGVVLDGWWTALAVVLGLAAVSTAVSSVMAVDDDAWFEGWVARRARTRAGAATTTDVPGVVFVQIDGLAKVVLERALRSGDVPTLHRWIRDDSHRLIGWETGWSSQTGVSQCGILHGSVRDMPAFRWVDKSTGSVVVSNRPASAAAIERHHSDGEGLLAHHGSSYGNLFSGDAERAVLTMSVIGRRKEGRLGSGYFGYFARPQLATRTMIGFVVEVVRERLAAWQQVRHDVQPRIERSWTYALLRAFTTVVSRDVSVLGVLTDMCEGRAVIYVDLLGYDEVAHHSGPERADTLAVLRNIDRQIGRIERAERFAPRPYQLVVLSDHGQTQGAPFAERNGETLAALVARLCGAAASGDPDAEAGRTESSAWLRRGRGRSAAPEPAIPGPAAPIVLGSGSLGLISLPDSDHRLTREEIEVRFPGLLAGLASHPEIGFVLVATSTGRSCVLGASGYLDVATGEVVGDDPLAPFGPLAIDQVREVDGYANVADIMVNSRYDIALDEVAAFEHQVGSHGGLGGPQTHPFALHPVDWETPMQPIVGSPALHRVLKGWLADLGHPVTTPWRTASGRPLGSGSDDDLAHGLAVDQ
jgi:uncharacterized membrane protein YvlD (DUF360 family)